MNLENLPALKPITILYQHSLTIDGRSNLDELYLRIREDFLNLLQAHTGNGFAGMDYEFICYRGSISEPNLLSFILSGAFKLKVPATNSVIGKFDCGYRDFFSELKDSLKEDGSPATLEVCLSGYED